MTTLIDMNDRGWRIVEAWDEPRPPLSCRQMVSPERCYACREWTGYEFLVPVKNPNGLHPIGITMLWVAGHEQCVRDLGRAWEAQYQKNHEWDWAVEDLRFRYGW